MRSNETKLVNKLYCLYTDISFSLVQASRVYANELTAQSILGNMLPDAMIAYLENHTPDEFATIFLGSAETPETIWNSEMR